MAINTYFQNIANAIRTKTGSAGLITPADMPDEILNIPTGSNILETPLHTEVRNGYIENGNFYYGINTYNSYIFQNLSAGKYIVVRNGGNIYARLRLAYFNNDPINFTSNQAGTSKGSDDRTDEYIYYMFTLNETAPFLMCYMGYVSASAKVQIINVQKLFE